MVLLKDSFVEVCMIKVQLISQFVLNMLQNYRVQVLDDNWLIWPRVCSLLCVPLDCIAIAVVALVGDANLKIFLL